MSAILEAANDARSTVRYEVVEMANRLARLDVDPEEVAAVLDALREGVLKNKHLKSHRDIAEELAWVAEFCGEAV